MDELKELNNKYFELFSDLRLALEWLPDKEYDKMAKVLDEQYRAELDMTLKKQMLETGIDNYELNYRVATEVPKDRRILGIFPRRNRTAKALRKIYAAQYANFLALLDNQRLSINIEKCDTQAASNDLKTELTAKQDKQALPTATGVAGQLTAPKEPESEENG